MSTRQAVILAGGLGTRLKPYTDKIPKPLVEVHGRPFLVWQLEYLRGQGITRALLLISYLGEQIVDYFNSHPIDGLTIDYNSEPSPLGTGGALKLAESKLEPRFWLFNGDTFMKIDLKRVESQAKAPVMVVYGKPKDLGVQGNVDVQAGKAVAYAEDAKYVDAGAYLLEREAVLRHPAGKFQMSDLLKAPMSRGEVAAFNSEVPFYDIGTVERLKNAPRELFGAK